MRVLLTRWSRHRAAFALPPRTEVPTMLLFERTAWGRDAARAWAKSHGFNFGRLDATPRYVRLRQVDGVAAIDVVRFGTRTLGAGIRAIVGIR